MGRKILVDRYHIYFSKYGDLTDEAAYFRPILVDLQELVRQFGEFDPVVRDVQNIRIDVDVVYSMRIKC